MNASKRDKLRRIELVPVATALRTIRLGIVIKAITVVGIVNRTVGIPENPRLWFVQRANFTGSPFESTLRPPSTSHVCFGELAVQPFFPVQTSLPLARGRLVIISGQGVVVSFAVLLTIPYHLPWFFPSVDLKITFPWLIGVFERAVIGRRRGLRGCGRCLRFVFRFRLLSLGFRFRLRLYCYSCLIGLRRKGSGLCSLSGSTDCSRHSSGRFTSFRITEFCTCAALTPCSTLGQSEWRPPELFHGVTYTLVQGTGMHRAELSPVAWAHCAGDLGTTDGIWQSHWHWRFTGTQTDEITLV